MRIGIDARFLGSGTGIGRYIQKLVENLEKIDRQNDYIIFLRKENWDYYHPNFLNFHKHLADAPWYTLAEQIKLPLSVAREKIDIMHYPHFNVPIFARTPFVVTIHDLILLEFPTSRATTRHPLIFKTKYWMYKKVINYAIANSRAIIVPSEYTKEQVVKNFQIKTEKVHIIYEGASRLGQNQATPAFGHKITNVGKNQTQIYGNFRQKKVIKPYLLYVGNAYPHKNLERLLRVFAKLKKQGLNYQLVLVGKLDFFYERLRKFAADILPKNVLDNVVFYDSASEDELVKLYKRAALYVFPSLLEGFGLPPLEAMVFGLPVAASHASSLPEILGNAALYFKPEDEQDMLEKIKLGLNNQNLRRALIQEGYKRIKKYSWERCARQTLSIYLLPNVV